MKLKLITERTLTSPGRVYPLIAIVTDTPDNQSLPEEVYPAENRIVYRLPQIA